MTKLLGPKFLVVLIFVDQNFFDKTSFDPISFLSKSFLYPNIFTFWPKYFVDTIFFYLNFAGLCTQKCLSPKSFWIKFVLALEFFWIQNCFWNNFLNKNNDNNNNNHNYSFNGV